MPSTTQNPAEFIELAYKWPKDFFRTIDYLETRPREFDTSKLAFFGLSWGATFGSNVLALEPRFKTAVFQVGGTTFPIAASLAPWNFAPRVDIPVLMLNGEDDFTQPWDGQIALFRALGTREPDKQHLHYPGGHGDLLSRPEPIKDTLAWLDKYLGPIGRQP